MNNQKADMDIDANNNNSMSNIQAEALTKVEAYSFFNFCKHLQRISRKSKSDDKKGILRELWKNFDSKTSYYPLMRLLLPQLDMVRGAFHIKEKTMGGLYVKAIPLQPKSRDALSLTKFKLPKYAKENVGNFTKCLYKILSSRCSKQSSKNIFQVNEDLFSLIQCENQSVCIFNI